MANINNIFAGVLGFILAMGLTFLFWNPMQNFLDEITKTNTELGVFLYICWIVLIIILNLVVPITLATTDDRGR